MCAGKTNNKKKKQNIVTVVTASTMQYLTQHPKAHLRVGMLRMFVGGQ